MHSSVSVCPVPPEQRPINEYQTLRESCFFRWAASSLPDYSLTLVKIWSLSWLVMGPVAAASFAPQEYPVRFALSATAGAIFFLGLILLRSYLGWSYVCDRLLRGTVFYEETGWYDGQLWSKPAAELEKDQIVGTYEVQPILRRLRRTFSLLGCLLGSGYLLWNFL